MKITHGIQLISVLLGLFTLGSLYAAEETTGAADIDRKSFECDPATKASISCKRYGTLVKMWECGENDYMVTDQSVEYAAKVACKKYLAIKPTLDLKQEAYDELLKDKTQRELLKDTLKQQLIKDLTK